MKKMKYFALVLICGICFVSGLLLRGKLAGEDTENENYTLRKTYENVKISTYSDYNETNYQSYLENLTTIPEGLTENCDNIYFTNEDLNEKFSDVVSGITNRMVALSYGSDIYVYTGYYSDDTLTHELWHIYDYTHGWVSASDEFLELYEVYKNDYSVTPGNVENHYEFFASYGKLFMLNNETLEHNDLYAFFEDLTSTFTY